MFMCIGGTWSFSVPPMETPSLSCTGDSVLGKNAVIRTNYGDIHINLFGEHCPRTVENFR